MYFRQSEKLVAFTITVIHSALSSIITRPSEDCAENAAKETQTINWSKENKCVLVKEAVAAPGAKVYLQTLQ